MWRFKGIFDDLCLLSCTHTYCYKCIEQIACTNKNQFECPLRDGCRIGRLNQTDIYIYIYIYIYILRNRMENVSKSNEKLWNHCTKFLEGGRRTAEETSRLIIGSH